MRIWIICSDSKFGLGFFPLFWLARDFWSCYKTANTTPRSSKEQTINGGGGSQNPQRRDTWAGEVCALEISPVPAKTQTV